MNKNDLNNRTMLQKHLETYTIGDLQKLIKCFQYELTLKNADRDSINEIIDCIQKAIAKVS